MKKIVSVILCFAIMISLLSAFASASGDEIEAEKKAITEQKNNTPDEEKTNQIFVKAIDGKKTEDIIADALKDFEYEIAKKYDSTNIYLVELESVKEADAAVDILNARKDVKFSEPNYRISLSLPDETECIEEKEPVGHADLAAPSPWAAEFISKAERIGITEHFKAAWTNSITREQFCILAYNMLDRGAKISWKKVSPNPFEDTDNEKVIALYLEDIIEGKGDRKFAPDDNITREEAATILTRIAENRNLEYTEMYFDFSDNAQISGWAMEAVQKVCNLGVMKGIGDNKFDPKGGYTVEQAIITLVRMFDLISEEKYAYMTFADKMYVNMPDDKNYMFSPLSIKMALMMAANGAYGETKSEILDVINVSDLEHYNECIRLMLDKYSKAEILNLNVANSIWINSEKTHQRFLKDYENKLSDVFDATSGIVTNETATKEINGWVNEKTNGKIPAIISEDNKDFWAMLLNAVYFKARWKNEFHKGATKKDEFYSEDGKVASVDFMNRTVWMNYTKSDGITIVELPYLNREEIIDENGQYKGMKTIDGVDISMYLLMSDKDFNPEEVLDKSELSSKYIALSVPKFNIEYSTGLNDILKTVGIKKAFEADADFSGMFDSGNMQIDSVIHKTYIKVDEEGTEAAAVTGIGMAGSALPPEPLEIKFNKPFTFVIKDNINEEILFIGEHSFV